MGPVLFYTGAVPVWSYGTFIAVGMITLFALALISARRDGRSWEQLLPVAMGVMVGGVFGARLSHLEAVMNFGDGKLWECRGNHIQVM